MTAARSHTGAQALLKLVINEQICDAGAFHELSAGGAPSFCWMRARWVSIVRTL
jgi:hypothetical protein